MQSSFRWILKLRFAVKYHPRNVHAVPNAGLMQYSKSISLQSTIANPFPEGGITNSLPLCNISMSLFRRNITNPASKAINVTVYNFMSLYIISTCDSPGREFVVHMHTWILDMWRCAMRETLRNWKCGCNVRMGWWATEEFRTNT